jgi:hypothetical protein
LRYKSQLKKKNTKKKIVGTYMSILICKGVVGVAVIWRLGQGRRVPDLPWIFAFVSGLMFTRAKKLKD